MKKYIFFEDPTKKPVHAPPPLSLYIHFPWCVKKCPYCDFNSHPLRGGTIDEKNYIDALICDLEQELPYIWGRKLMSIYLGGGTPSLFSARSIDRLIAQIRMRIVVQPDAQITLELNPGTFEKKLLQDYFSAGINRLSIGVQSFNDKHLKSLGRIHDSDTAKSTINAALKVFPFVNIDLMYALPEQTLSEALIDFKTAVSFDTGHISAYQLTIEENTLFGVHPPLGLPEDQNLSDIEENIHQFLFENGYHRYEISAFAREGHQSEHNLNYWKFGDYIGIGAGAHGKITLSDKIERTLKHKHPKEYLLHNFKHASQRKIVEINAIPFEFMLNALRLIEGFDISLFEERTRLSFTSIYNKIQLLEEKGFINIQNERIIPTPLGLKFLNDALLLFLD